jgi:hypothetical protein
VVFNFIGPPIGGPTFLLALPVPTGVTPAARSVLELGMYSGYTDPLGLVLKWPRGHLTRGVQFCTPPQISELRLSRLRVW